MMLYVLWKTGIILVKYRNNKKVWIRSFYVTTIYSIVKDWMTKDFRTYCVMSVKDQIYLIVLYPEILCLSHFMAIYFDIAIFVAVGIRPICGDFCSQSTKSFFANFIRCEIISLIRGGHLLITLARQKKTRSHMDAYT